MSVGSVGSSATTNSSSASSTSNAADPFANLNLNDFIQMMITELQNQDPTNPMSSSQMLQEITQMGQISTAEQLDTTLTGMETGQNLSNASAMIGMQVEGTDSRRQFGLGNGQQRDDQQWRAIAERWQQHAHARRNHQHSAVRCQFVPGQQRQWRFRQQWHDRYDDADQRQLDSRLVPTHGPTPIAGTEREHSQTPIIIQREGF